MGKKRGSYRKKYRIPRQTIYNKTRKRTLFTAVQINNTADDASIDPPLSAIETELENEAIIDAGTENEIIGDISAETDTSITSFTSNDSSMDNSEDRLLQQETTSMLYKDSYLSVQSSEIMIKSFVCRHHLSGQAQEDLLQLLQFHLPEGNKLSSSLYLFDKNSQSQSITVDSQIHYCCSKCYLILESDEQKCCDTAEKPLCFYSLSIADQLRKIISSKC